VIPHGVEIFVVRDPVNMRLSFDRLAGFAEAVVGRPARSRALFVFFGKRRDALKVLFYDGTGLCIFYKRLDKGRFQIPDVTTGGESVEIAEHELEALLDGLSAVAAPVKRARKVLAH
jgi:transposase